MKPYVRTHPEFSLCGLPCGLCPRHRTEGSSRCPGCGGPDFHEKHPACAVITCSGKHGGPAYCAECADYPCIRYREMPEVDSFISYAGVRRDLDRIQMEGPNGLLADIARRMEMLDALLERWDDGRSKAYFCLAAQLLPLSALEGVLRDLARPEAAGLGEAKARARHARALLGREADALSIPIELRKKPTE